MCKSLHVVKLQTGALQKDGSTSDPPCSTPPSLHGQCDLVQLPLLALANRNARRGLGPRGTIDSACFLPCSAGAIVIKIGKKKKKAEEEGEQKRQQAMWQSAVG